MNFFNIIFTPEIIMKKTKSKISAKKVAVKTKKAAVKKAVKKQTVKKAAVKSNKSAPKKQAKSQSVKTKNSSAFNEIKELKSELSVLLDKMDASEVNQIVRQAKILLQNKSVIESVRLNNARRESMPGPDKSKIEVKEALDSTYFIIKINGANNFFSLEEMRKVVKVCGYASNEKDGAANLYAYLSKNRVDVINDTSIYGPDDQALKTIYNYLVSNYKVKQ
jgi:hypothetical protein